MSEYYISNILIGILKVLFILLPIPLIFALKHLWYNYVLKKFVSGIDWQLLEIVIPQEVTKTPLAIETILANSMYQKTKKDLFSKYWKGQVPLYFSLEIVSTEGQIHFYINTPSRVAPLIKSQVYAQFPQAKVLEVDDYAWAVPKVGKKTGWNVAIFDWMLEKEEARPIKTYIDYGLDKPAKDPNENVDPLVSLIEFMSAIGPGEHMWCQLVIRFSDKKYDGLDFAAYSEKVLNDITEKYNKTEDEETKKFAQMRVPEYTKDEMKAIARKQHKLLFDCGLRTVYVAKNEVFDPQKKRALRMMFRQYSGGHYNNLKILGKSSDDYFDLENQGALNGYLDAYRIRSFFYPPWKMTADLPGVLKMFVWDYKTPPYFTLNTEEIATLWHFPAGVVSTPSIKRVETKTGQAPTNLPI